MLLLEDLPRPCFDGIIHLTSPILSASIQVLTVNRVFVFGLIFVPKESESSCKPRSGKVPGYLERYVPTLCLLQVVSVCQGGWADP